jgi:hypothetical protein
MSGVLELSLLFLILGATGFTRRGLPISTKRRISGRRGKVVGSVSLLVGILGILLAFLGSTPAEREAMRFLGYGIVTGVLGTILVLGGFESENN